MHIKKNISILAFVFCFFVFVYHCAEVDSSALFLCSKLSVFLKNLKKMTSFLEKSGYF